MQRKILLCFGLFVLSVLSLRSYAREFNQLSILKINSAITPATYDYLKYQFGQIPQDSLILIKLNTPGGLVTTTKEIISLMGQETRPVIVWVTPEGASAASAGALIASAAHFIFMTPGTNMGAATPIELSGDIKESDARNKAVNDLTALVRSLSVLRGRPAGPFEDMIRKADSYSHQEAMNVKIIEGVFSKETEVITFLKDKSYGQKEVITLSDKLTTKEYEPTLGQKLLEVIANPSTAYILFLVGVALIYFEFQAPGGYIAGAAGFLLVLLAGIAFQVLPLDWGALGLVILGIVFLILEVFVTSYITSCIQRSLPWWFLSDFSFGFSTENKNAWANLRIFLQFKGNMVW